MNHPFQIDGQRQPKQPEPQIDFRNIDQPSACHEIPLELWIAEASKAAEWPKTVPMDLLELSCK